MKARKYPCVLYRHFSKNNVLLYIGSTKDIFERNRSHLSNSYWYVEVAYITLEYFDDRNEAFLKEREAILSENPLYNNHAKDRILQRKVRGIYFCEPAEKWVGGFFYRENYYPIGGFDDYQSAAGSGSV